MFALNLREKFTVGLRSCKWVNKIKAMISQSITGCQESDTIIPVYTDPFKGIRILLFAEEFTRKSKTTGRDNGKCHADF